MPGVQLQLTDPPASARVTPPMVADSGAAAGVVSVASSVTLGTAAKADPVPAAPTCTASASTSSVNVTDGPVAPPMAPDAAWHCAPTCTAVGGPPVVHTARATLPTWNGSQGSAAVPLPAGAGWPNSVAIAPSSSA